MHDELGGEQVADTRRPAYGLGRVVALAWGLFAIYFSAHTMVWIVREPGDSGVLQAASTLGSVAFMTATVALSHNGRKMRVVAALCSIGLLAGVIALGIGLFVVAGPDGILGPIRYFGRYSFYMPVILPLTALIWLWFSSPRRLANS